jgi:very-short-patch-repair endonuclease
MILLAVKIDSPSHREGVRGRGLKHVFMEGNMDLKSWASNLRNNSTDVERLLWERLRRQQLDRYKFRRQVVIEPYIVDFACFEAKLVIELDGGQHQFEEEKDRERDEYLKRCGYQVLRFWNNEVTSNIEGVLEVIRTHLITPP